MAKQTILLGSTANDGNGDPLRQGGDKVNDNFNEIYALLGDGTTLSSAPIVYEANTATLTNKTINSADNTLTINGAQATLSNIANSALINSAVTIGSTSVSLGQTELTLTGLTSVTSTDFVGNLTGNVTGAVTGNVTGNLTGDVTGDVIGNVVGNVTGNITGTAHTGDLTGDVTGNLTGNVTGNVVGNVTGNTTGDVTGDVLAANGSIIIQSLATGGEITAQTLIGDFTTPTPSSSGDSGTAGEVRWDSNYIYICVAQDTWKRAAISTW